VLTPTRGPEATLEELDRLGDDVTSYQPAWAVRAQALAALGRNAEAAECHARAAGLTEDPAVREHLLAQADTLRAARREG
jgi:RNA polymerase sigma-70 factor (ECF subfamily)